MTGAEDTSRQRGCRNKGLGLAGWSCRHGTTTATPARIPDNHDRVGGML